MLMKSVHWSSSPSHSLALEALKGSLSILRGGVAIQLVTRSVDVRSA